jgi:nickel transport protein
LASQAAAVVLGVLLLASSPAHAHKLKVFATTVGAQIDGRAYFVGGGPAKGANVTIETPSGRHLATLHTDTDGKFEFSASTRVDHVIAIDAGDGHFARCVIPADELPQSLPTSALDSAHLDPPEPPPVPAANEMSPSGESLEDVVAQAVASQVRPLREQLNDYEDQVRLHDVLGGIGYIAGIAGLAAWIRSRRFESARR